MKLFVVLFFTTSYILIFSQNAIQKDTSYTPFSTYIKEIKKYPFIQIALKKNLEYTIVDKEIIYKTINSRALHLDAFYGKSKKVCPAVILIHGGGWKSGDKSQMETMAIAIASKGYSCFAIEYRLSTEAQFPAAIFDIKKAIEFVRNNAVRFNVEPSKIAVLGCSSGGQMAALIGATNGDLRFEEGGSPNTKASNVQAIINMDGILAFKHPESQEGKIASLWLGGDYETIPEIWSNASALSHIDKNTPPILFINSDKPRFHAGRDDVIEILKKQGTYYDVKNIENSPHSFWFFDPWFEPMVKWTVEFLDTIFK